MLTETEKDFFAFGKARSGRLEIFRSSDSGGVATDSIATPEHCAYDATEPCCRGRVTRGWALRDWYVIVSDKKQRQDSHPIFPNIKEQPATPRALCRIRGRIR
jgi:hypothetical protein